MTTAVGSFRESLHRISDHAQDLQLSVLESLDLIERSKELLRQPVFRGFDESPPEPTGGGLRRRSRTR